MKNLRTILFLLLFTTNTIQAQCLDSTKALDHMEEQFIELINAEGESILLKVKVADEVGEQAAGFQHVCPERFNSTAILFVFGQAKKPTFHMNNVYANLDIAFIDEQGLIGDIQLMHEEFSTGNSQLYPSEVITKYALEVHQGFYEANNITAGNSYLKFDG